MPSGGIRQSHVGNPPGERELRRRRLSLVSRLGTPAHPRLGGGTQHSGSAPWGDRRTLAGTERDQLSPYRTRASSNSVVSCDSGRVRGPEVRLGEQLLAAERELAKAATEVANARERAVPRETMERR